MTLTINLQIFYLYIFIPLFFNSIGDFIYNTLKSISSDIRFDFFEKNILSISTVSVFTTIAYQSGLKLSYIAFILSIVAFTGLLYNYKNYLHIFKCDVLRAFTFLALISILCGPYLLGGMRVYIFQGNHYDVFNYIQSALTYNEIPSRFINFNNISHIIESNGFPKSISFKNISTIPLLLAILYRVSGASIFAIGPVLVNIAIFYVAGVLSKLAKIVIPNLSEMLCFTIGFCFSFGFWGQYIQDIDAWRCCIWLPVLILSITYVYDLNNFYGLETNKYYELTIFKLVCSITALNILYIEGTLYLTPAILLIYFIIQYINKNILKSIKYFCIFFIFWIIAIILFDKVYFSDIFTLIGKLKPKNSISAEWWKYFDAYLFGDTVEGFRPVYKTLGDLLLGACGLYYFTLTNILSKYLVRICEIGAIIGSLYIFIKSIYILKERNNSIPTKLYVLMMYALLIQITGLFILHKYWLAGKALSYSSPLLLLFIFLCLLHKSSKIIYYRLIDNIFIFIIIISSMGFGVVRVFAAYKTSDGILYSLPYPSVQDSGYDKKLFDFSDDTVLDKLSHDELVEVNIKDTWIEAFVEMSLKDRKIRYISYNPVTIETGLPEQIPPMDLHMKDMKVKHCLVLDFDRSRRFPYYIKLINK